MTLYLQVEAIIRNRGKVSSGEDYRLEDDGSGAIIREWNVAALGSEPTQTELDAVDVDAEILSLQKDLKYNACDKQLAIRILQTTGGKIRGSSGKDKANFDVSMQILSNGPHKNAIKVLGEKIETLKDLIEAATDQATLDVIDVTDNANW